MGLAASQTRFLQLTSRKSNIEFQGQQLNQQRLILANNSAGLFQRQLSLVPPSPPVSTSNAYTTPAYSFNCAVAGIKKTIQFTHDGTGAVVGAKITYNSYDSSSASTVKTVNVMDSPATGLDDGNSNGITNSHWATDVRFDSATGRLARLNLSVWDAVTSSAIDTVYDSSNLTYAPIFDEIKYNDDMNKYEYEKNVYDNEVEQINATTAHVQNQDRSLELKMKQLDTEHNALQTEIESVQKVLQNNLEHSFKTFS